MTDDATATGDPTERPVALRLATLHLRMGSLPLARAELESLAGRGMLDDAALLDLAEVRWRTGDLAGAGEAANVLIEQGRSDRLALVIAAESVSALGRPSEARRLATRASRRTRARSSCCSRACPRSSIWPADAPAEGEPPVAADLGEPVPPRVVPGAVSARSAPASLEPPAPTGAAEAFAGGQAALGAGDTPLAALRLGVALRLEQGYARDVLDGDRGAGDRPGARVGCRRRPPPPRSRVGSARGVRHRAADTSTPRRSRTSASVPPTPPRTSPPDAADGRRACRRGTPALDRATLRAAPRVPGSPPAGTALREP